jgi:hypothetical protein
MIMLCCVSLSDVPWEREASAFRGSNVSTESEAPTHPSPSTHTHTPWEPRREEEGGRLQEGVGARRVVLWTWEEVPEVVWRVWRECATARRLTAAAAAPPTGTHSDNYPL